ncbi:MAG: hypothetical protein US74_C0011G0011 [Parcubacteria group bacterium GW2011_GWA2_38_13]|nr:MAG: hypothetical protein US74_C0011G0011 [Parcubacteria group bacterium GW2011_GWA2_38_13]
MHFIMIYYKNMNIKKMKIVIDYWKKTAQHDYDTMITLFENKRYSDSLFYGHIVLEKILKAHVVRKTKKQAPYIHNLLTLKNLANLHVSNKEIDLLDMVNSFNIRARYPEQRLEFYKRCTKKYAEEYIGQIKSLYKKLCQKPM